jgi:hypothetical protein
MHKESFFINCNTLLHVSTLLGHLQGELSVVVTVRLHYTVERECAVDCVLRCFWRRELSVVSACTMYTMYIVYDLKGIIAADTCQWTRHLLSTNDTHSRVSV